LTVNSAVAAGLSGFNPLDATLRRIKNFGEVTMENAIEFLDSINRVAPIGFGIVVDRVFRMINRYLTYMTGYSREELIGQSARMLYETQAEYERVGKEKYDQIRRTGTGTIETRFRCKDGRLVDVLLASTPLDVNDFSAGVTFTVTDITDVVQTQRRLRQSLDETEQVVLHHTRELIDTNHLLKDEIERRERTEQKLIKSKRALQTTIRKLKAAQSSLIQSEKLASVGQLAAGIAHEINNPTAFVSSNLKTGEGYLKEIATLIDGYRQSVALMTRSTGERLTEVQIQSVADGIQQAEANTDFEFLMSDLTEIFEECLEGTERIRKIVADLKDFAHPEAPERHSADIHQCLDSTINIVWNELKYKAELIKEYGELPPVNCYSHQINQVFVNLLVNAAHAIEKKGIIRIRTQARGENVEVHISDTGHGIPKQIRTRIFDPFFTTKAVGNGTGLGLSMSYGIVQRHHGKILVESEVGKGTCFTVILPIGEEACR
jgi:two-component system, NtrC family, sensor kinase